MKKTVLIMNFQTINANNSLTDGIYKNLKYGKYVH